jgi:phage terminase Nu1 subunit (DNA packaging protein)
MKRAEVANALLVDATTVDHWKAAGLPHDPYDMAVIMEWRIAHECEKVRAKPSGAESEEALERKRHWDAENAMLKNQQLKGDLLEKDAVFKEVAEVAHRVRGALMNMGSELSVRLSRTSDALEIREMIDKAVVEKLSSLRLDQ